MLKENKGITLIALAITVIVMLILVGVTISISLNGRLFTTAKQATDETQIAKEKEELLMAALGVLNKNGEVELSKLDSSLPEGFTGSNGQYTSSKTGNIFTVTEDGTITLVGEPSGEEPETPVVPPATPTIELNPKTITEEIESGTATEVGTITATVTNVDGDLQWSITPTDSGLELVDTDNANVKKIKASKAVENATITVSYGTVSDTCSVTITEKEPEIITFYVGEDEYTVEEGTDWKTWIEEEGNKYGFRVAYLPNGIGLVLYEPSNQEDDGIGYYVRTAEGTDVSPNEQISALHYLLGR